MQEYEGDDQDSAVVISSPVVKEMTLSTQFKRGDAKESLKLSFRLVT